MVKFTCDKARVFSGGDDNLLKLFDIGTESEILSYNEHEVGVILYLC